MPEFQLGARSPKVHKSIRSICVCDANNLILTAGLDGRLVGWSIVVVGSETSSAAPNGAAPMFIERFKSMPHDGEMIYALALPIQRSILESEEANDTRVDLGLFAGAVFSGGQDTRIVWSSLADGSVGGDLKGHTGPVCSLTFCWLSSDADSGKRRLFLASGSWDGTAKIWKFGATLSEHHCIATLAPHSYAVCVASAESLGTQGQLNGDIIVTGCQSGTLKIWTPRNNFAIPTCEIPGHHSDLIRCVCACDKIFDPQSGDPVAAVLTCSNDGSVKALSQKTGDLLFSFPVGAREFVLGFAPDSRRAMLATASEGGVVRLWELSPPYKLVQAISHPCSIWAVVFLANGDLVTGGEDGLLRLWTTDSLRVLPTDAIEECCGETVVSGDAVTQEQDSSVDISKLRTVSELSTVRGSRRGQHCLFREGSKAIVFVWDGSSWDRVGEMISREHQADPQRSRGGNPTMGGQYYAGDSHFDAGYYDYVFTVDVDSGSYKPLPFRVGDDVDTAAEIFCARENISASLAVPQIVTFIRENAVRNPASAARSPNQPNNDSVAPFNLAPSSGNLGLPKKFFPPTEYVTFKASVNMKDLKQKLQEFNTALSTAESPLALPDFEMEYLVELLDRLESTTTSSPAGRRNLAINLRDREVDVSFRSSLRNWPVQYMTPVLNLWRILVLSSKSTELHKRGDRGWSFMAAALRGCEALKEGNCGLALCGLWYLSNLAEYPTNRSALLDYLPQILIQLTSTVEPLEAGASVPDAKVQRYQDCMSGFLLNVALAIHQHSYTPSDALTMQFGDLAKRLLAASAPRNAKTAFNVLVAVGTFLLQRRKWIMKQSLSSQRASVSIEDTERDMYVRSMGLDSLEIESFQDDVLRDCFTETLTLARSVHPAWCRR